MLWLVFFAVGIAAGLVYTFDETHKTSGLNIAVVCYLGFGAWLFSVSDVGSYGFGLLLLVIALIAVGVFVAMNFDTLRRIKEHYEKKLNSQALENAKHAAKALMEKAETRLLAGRATQMDAEVPEILKTEEKVRKANRKRELAQAQRDAEYVDIGRQATVEMRQHVIDLVKARKEEKMLNYLTRIAAPGPNNETVEEAEEVHTTDSLDGLKTWYYRGLAQEAEWLATEPSNPKLQPLQDALARVRQTLADAGKI